MPRFSTMEIVKEEEILLRDEIIDMRISESFLYDVFADKSLQNLFLAKIGIFKNSFFCGRCSDGTKLKYIKRKPSPDGFHWVCRRTCRFTTSIRKDSVFEESRLDMRTIFFIMYKYINRIPITDIAYELCVDRGTVSEYSAMAREVIGEYICENSEKLGGYNDDGTSKIVEIDESYFFKRKYNRGRLTNGQWYVGGVERGSKKTFLIPVSNRNQLTMRTIIQENVLPGTIIVTDQWRAYSAALRDDETYEHRPVNHSINFVDPEDPSVHTQTIDGLWGHMKKFLRGKSGISKEQQSEFLIQFLWEHKIDKRKRINVLLSLFRINF